MNDQSNQSSPSQSDSEKPARSKMERAIVWTVIGLLILFTGVEATSQLSYKKSLKGFEDAESEAEKVLTLDDFEDEHKMGFAIKSFSTKDGKNIVQFKWPSLLKRYELNFAIMPGDEEKVLVSYWTNDDPAASVTMPRPEGIVEGDPMGMDQGMGMGMPGGGGGEPGDGGPDGPGEEGGERPSRPE